MTAPEGQQFWSKQLYRPLGEAERHGGNVSFSEYVSTLSESVRRGARVSTQMNEHWAPAWLICGMDTVEYDFLGRLEHVDADVRELFAAVGIDEPGLPTREQVSFAATNAADEAPALYTEHLVELVGEAYRVDAHLGGYSLEDAKKTLVASGTS